MGFHKSNSKHFHNGWSGSLMMTVRGAGAGRDWGKRGVVRLCVCVYTCACVDAGESEICSGVVMYFCNVSYLVLWALHRHSHRGIWSIRNAFITAVWSPLLLPCVFSLRLFSIWIYYLFSGFVRARLHCADLLHCTVAGFSPCGAWGFPLPCHLQSPQAQRLTRQIWRGYQRNHPHSGS